MENQIIIIMLKKTLRGKTPSQYEHTRATGQGSKLTTGCLKTQVSAAKGQSTTRQPSWQWNFGPQNYRTNGN